MSGLRRFWPLFLVGLVLLGAVSIGLTLRQAYPTAGADPEVRAVIDSTSARPREQEPGPSTVEFTPDASAHPDAPAIKSLLTGYFEAINSRNFDQWRAHVTAKVSQETQRAVWNADYATTKDGSILVRRVINSPGGTLRIMLTFTSTQDPAKSPPDARSDCNRWRATYQLAVEGRTLRIDKGSPLSTIVSAC
ncbi:MULTISPECIES: hypothetical protein [unclassified Crossiella]|uniref:hypothetical protein n=1 Tax=unclassified Crossiella TaxID=2620835 RepID=UPI001FFF77F5|nr:MULTISPECIES: hypothetical protein [unclassified Crossiella]MCK2240804.1 hypothetical protein [Crossiella sp. S99.2]MCK2254052.1 hypothetical protein [Crossiella sp. S99.1]